MPPRLFLRASNHIGAPVIDTNAFESHLAGVGEDGRAVVLDMLVAPDAGLGLGRDRCVRGLADLKRIASHAVAIQLDQVEGVEEYAAVSAVVTDEIKGPLRS